MTNEQKIKDRTMKDIMDEIIRKPEFRAYCREVFALASDPVLDLLAPQVETPIILGKCRTYSEGNRLWLPDTRRQNGTAAASIRSDILNDTYTCLAHALGTQVDIDTVDALELEIVAKNNVYMLASITSFARLMRTVKLIKKSVEEEYADFLDDPAKDPIEAMDGYIEDVLKAGKAEWAGVIFGANAWKRFKRHPLLKNQANPSSLSYEVQPTLFTGNAKYRPCFMVNPDTEDFALNDEILIFSRTNTPSIISRDFMKRYVHVGLLNGIKAYGSVNETQMHTDINWQEDIKISNSAGIKLLNTKN